MAAGKKKAKRQPVQKKSTGKKASTKKKPPVKKKPKRKPVKKKPVQETARVELDVPVSISPDAYKNNIRLLTGRLYIMNIAPISLRQISEMEEYGRPVLKTLEYWCKVDGWVAAREEFQKNIEEGLRKRVASEIIRDQLDTVKDLQRIREDLMHRLLPLEGEARVIPPARSLEGLVSATVKVTKQVNDMLNDLGPKVVPGVLEKLIQEADRLQGGGESAQQRGLPKPSLTAEEAQAMAQMIMKMRLQKMREAQAEEAREESETGASD